MKSEMLIAGAGVPGLVLALKAAPHVPVSVVDAGPPPPALKDAKPDGRTVALMGGSISILEETGVWPHIKKFCAPLKNMTVIDDSFFPAHAQNMVEQIFSAQEIDRQEFGWNMPLSVLRSALAEKTAKNNNIHMLWNTAFKDIKTGDFALTVGMDGRNSAVRDMANIPVKRHAYGQTAITCMIAHTHSHNDTSAEFHRSGGPFTYVPMPGNHCAVVWVEKDNDAEHILKLPKAAFINALQERTRGKLGTIELIGTPASWKLEYLRAERLTAPRVALGAEAAHVISPIGAQGLNLSLRDAKTLANIIIEAKETGLDIGSPTVLERYEKARRPDISSRSFTIDLVNRAVANDAPLIKSLRRLALRITTLPGPWRALAMKKGLAA